MRPHGLLAQSTTAKKVAPLALARSSPIPPIARLLKLDAGSRPGLSISDFWSLWTICYCGVVTTRSAFPLHSKECVVELPDSEAEELSLDLSRMTLFGADSESDMEVEA